MHILYAGQQLLVNQSLHSPDGNFRLTLQDDGNLVEYRSDGSVGFVTDTVNKNTRNAIMQTDGNFVLYDYNNNAVWWSDTEGHPGAYLELQNDGNVVIYWWNRPAIWASPKGPY